MSADEDEEYLTINIEDAPTESQPYHRNRIKRLNQQLAKGMVESEKTKAARELDEILSKQIPEENKGFKMLEKMGFKKGYGLGKDGHGRSEPISINIKQDKAGVGKKTNQRFVTQKEQIERQKNFELEKRQFLISSKTRLDNTRLDRDLAVARQTCMNLDLRENKSRSAFWPSEQSFSNLPSIDGYSDRRHTEESLDTEFERQSVDEKLDTIVFYLRNCYNYCLWCSVEFENLKDLLENCPGETKAEHDE